MSLTPNNIALIYEGEELSYAELNERSNQLAHYLIELGVKPDTLVGICVERSLEMVIGLMGILKAGGAYVPLDPTYPQERLNFMLEDTGTDIVLCQTHVVSRLTLFGSFLTARKETKGIVFLDNEQVEKLSHYPVTNPESSSLGLTSANLAYVIYTSGSTGNPKGVMIEHKNVRNYLEFGLCAYSLEGIHGSIVSSSLNFDATITALFLPLCCGNFSRLLPDNEDILLNLRECILNDKMNLFFKITPTHLVALLNEKDFENRSRSHLISVGGERLTTRVLSQWVNDVLSDAVYVNQYGPTETTIGCSIYSIAGLKEFNLLNGLSSVPIGRPINNTQLYVLSSDFSVMPVGAVGELYIGGAGLARGYLNRPELTSEKFIANPFSDEEGSRLYRTGDRVRYLSDGNLEFIERIDDQIKIRGFRIELGEIESCLSKDESVRDCVVIAHDDDDDNKQLVAYIISEGSIEGDSGNAYEIVDDWQELYDEQYGEELEIDDVKFDVRGWESSYTKKAIPPSEMREWLDNTVERIDGTVLGDVLEVGCGSGMIMFSVAERSHSYTATDFSAEALQKLDEHLHQVSFDRSKIQLVKSTAVEIDQFGRNSFDQIIINSVCQYFPNKAYLDEFIEKAVHLVKSGGKIFIGDVRNLSSLDIFYASVELYQAEKDTKAGDVLSRIIQRAKNEKELVIHPHYFLTLPGKFSEISSVDVEFKQSENWNELSLFRYDVTIYFSERNCLVPNVKEIQWQGKDFGKYLSTIEQTHLNIRNFPLRNLSESLAKCDILKNLNEELTISSEISDDKEYNKYLNPNDIYRIAKNRGFNTRVVPSSNGRANYCDIIISKMDAQPIYASQFVNVKNEGHSFLTNTPLLRQIEHSLIENLRDKLSQRVPAYMVPNVFIFIEKFPLLSNGKIDKKSLPMPGDGDLQREKYVAPRNEVEEKLCSIWEEVLKVERVGIHDNFFELGGHSLLATRLISIIRREFGCEIRVLSLFEQPTVEGMNIEITTLQLEKKMLIAKSFESENMEEFEL